MFDFKLTGDLVSSPAVQYSLLLVVGLVFSMYTRARLREFMYVRKMLTSELTKLDSLGFVAGNLHFLTQTTFVVTLILERMSTTRSRWYVLHLAVRSLKRTTVREVLLDMIYFNRPTYTTGLGSRLKATVVSVFDEQPLDI